MDKKTTAIVSYITLIGWLIAFFTYKNETKSSLASYHLRQGLGLVIASFAYSILVFVVVFILALVSPALGGVIGMVLNLVSLVFLVLMIIGIINANNEQEKPLPIIGKMFENKFSFIP